jgi:GR25 family glycosyltransferase involved in LPS biosynthesis
MNPILILSFKNSPRIKNLKNRLNNLKLNYKIINGVNARSKKGQSILKKNYNKKRSEHYLGRKLPYSEMSTSYVHLKAYKYIIKKKIKRAIILEDDAWPSSSLKYWVNKKDFNEKVNIIGLNCYDGFVEKKAISLNEKFTIHVAKTHLFNPASFIIDYKTCKKIIDNTKGKICGNSDWPINFIKNKIISSISLPYTVAIDLNYVSLLAKDRKKAVLNKDRMKASYIKKLIPKSIYNIISFFYYILHIPYLTGRYRDISFFREHFYEKKIFSLQNLIFSNLINTKNIYLNKKFYCKDLWKVVKNNSLSL